MSSKSLRRRLHHGDVDGRRHEHLETSGLDSLSEPLLGDGDYSENKKVRTSSFKFYILGCKSLFPCKCDFLILYGVTSVCYLVRHT